MNKEDLLIDELIETYARTLLRSERKDIESRRLVLFTEIAESCPARLLKRIEREVESEHASHINELVNDLLIFTKIDIDSLLVHWLEHDEVTPESFLFRGAGPKAERALFEILNTEFWNGHYFALESLAWCRSKQAVQQFVQWKNNPPTWSKNFHFPVSV